MKTLTLTQPYATLIALGMKKIETRSWLTSYRGPLAIHAAKGYPVLARDLTSRSPFHDVLRASMPPLETTGEPPILPGLHLPLGAVVAVCELADCLPVDRFTLGSGFIELYDRTDNLSSVRWTLTDQERAFGDYSPGRYAWLLADIRALPEPIPCRGQLGLWEWEGGEG